MNLLLIALGGAVGSVARALVSRALPAGALPWGTIVVNVTGSFLIGWLIGRMGALDEQNLRAHSFWAIGVCGGYTTFSSFSLQTVDQMQKGHWGMALGNVVLSVVLCVVATWAGWRLAR